MFEVVVIATIAGLLFVMYNSIKSDGSGLSQDEITPTALETAATPEVMPDTQPVAAVAAAPEPEIAAAPETVSSTEARAVPDTTPAAEVATPQETVPVAVAPTVQKTAVSESPPAASVEPTEESTPAPKGPPVILNLRNPKTGEIAPFPNTYRFAKKWVKEMMVAEGLLPRVYNTSELDNQKVGNKVKEAIERLKALEKYHA